MQGRTPELSVCGLSLDRCVGTLPPAELGELLTDVPDWWVAEFMGTLPVKYIFVPALPDEFKEKYAVSAMAVYFDAEALEEIHSDQEDVKEKREEDAAQAKEDARKGL